MNEPSPPATSSFFRREMSKADAIIQVFRPQLNGRVNSALEVLSRIVGEAESLTKLGVMLQPAGQRIYVTPEDLAANLDEFVEVKLLAEKGREFLTALGYVPQKQHTPPVGTAPVGATVEVMPVQTQLPGEEPLESFGVVPKATNVKVTRKK
jgi:hypothetical protein